MTQQERKLAPPIHSFMVPVHVPALEDRPYGAHSLIY